MKRVATYFHRMRPDADMGALQAEHRRQFPGNVLAVLPSTTEGMVLVKVAYPEGTAKPSGTLTLEEARPQMVTRTTEATGNG